MHRPKGACLRGLSVPGRGLGSRLSPLLIAGLLLPAVAGACMPAAAAGSLQPTLTLQTVGSASVAFQNGIPVPTFDPQPRATLDLSGEWRLERASFDSDLSLTDRSTSLPTIEAQARGRQLASFDDRGWETASVPGAVNAPPDAGDGSAWYRRHFSVPANWGRHAVTLKFGAANYLADVWLNGHYLGYHEGGFTPFAFDVSSQLLAGRDNVLAIRVDAPEWGSRDDIVPWGLADWWNYGGLTQPVWLEASTSAIVDRADVVPHVDGADVTVTLEHRALAGETPRATKGDVVVEVMPAVLEPVRTGKVIGGGTELALAREFGAWKLTDPDVPALGRKEFNNVDLPATGAAIVQTTFSISGAKLWTPAHPYLYTLRVTLLTTSGEIDQIYQTFGLRRLTVDPDAPRLLLNGYPAAFSGASVHAEAIQDSGSGPLALPLTTVTQASAQLDRARQVNATLLRTAHQPGVPPLLMLADRLGFAIWEEIPLYHFTPRTFGISLGRGIPQQMLREMALRDMNRPSVMFYGLANESTGGQERADAMSQLDRVAHEIDGTRLTGQASYGFDPSDPTSDSLDVAGYTFYYGVFYGKDAAADTAAALDAAHARYPKKPIMVLEFGRWSDPPLGAIEQRDVLESTEKAILPRLDTQRDGFVGASVWWALDDYYTMRPGIEVERFGLFTPAGGPRLAGEAAGSLFAAAAPVDPDQLSVNPPLQAARVIGESSGTLRFVGYLAYGLLVVVATLAGLLAFNVILTRAQAPRRARR